MTISTTYPDILTNGTPADATQVMADFYQIQNDVNANAAHNGANSDITSLTGLTTPLGIAYGGTGGATASAALASLGAAPSANPIFTGLLTAAAITASGLITGESGLSLTGGATLDSLVVSGNAGVAGSFSVVGSANLAALTVSGATVLSSATGISRSMNDSTINLATTAFANPAALVSAIGYVTFPSGLILQWGTFTTGGASGATTFPKAFPNACFNITATGVGNSTIPIVSIGSFNQSSFTINSWAFSAGSSETLYWVAIGN